MRALVLALTMVTIVVVTSCGHTAGPASKSEAAEGPARDVRILRDTFGVPHVFGATDADCAFGLAYAHAEDDFRTIQLSLLASRGRLATVLGKEGGPNDFMVGLLRVQDFVASRYRRDLAPSTRALLEAYADGLNRYGEQHRDALVSDEVLPFRGEDIVAGFVHKGPLFFGLHLVLGKVNDGTYGQDLPSPFGSNAFAVAPHRSADGHTRLVVNSHQPWEGAVAWYEAHLVSEEGLDIVGGTFPGAPLILHGHNRHLGWAHTVNSPDLIDVYRLEVDGDRYRFGDEWRDLDVRRVPIEVKLFGDFTITVREKVGWSVHGPVMFTDHGVFALRYAGMGDVRMVEQWYRMGRAEDLEAWWSAMEMQAIPALNAVYADEDGRVLYLYNARAPIRAEGYDWSGILPGHDPNTLWRGYHPIGRVPRVLDPRSGFVQSTNATPFEATDGDDNPNPSDAPAHLGVETWRTNRSLRAHETFGADEAISADELLSYKYDLRYSERSWQAEVVKRLLADPPSGDPVLVEAHEVLARWDFSTTPDNEAAAIAVLTLQPLQAALETRSAPPDEKQAFADAARHLKQHYGKIAVPWSEVNRLVRGEVDLGLAGGPDVLHAVGAGPPENGRRVGRAGDSYILVVDWGPGGVQSHSVHQYGSATLDEKSPHFADQAPLFAERKLKPVWMEEADIRANLEREYTPYQ